MVKAALQSPLDGYQSPYNLQQHVNFVGDDLHIYELRYDTAWHVSDLTHLAGAPAAAYPSGIVGYVTAYNNQQHINFYGLVGQHLHVHELVYDGAWHHNDLTQLSGAPSVVDLVGRPASYVSSCNNQQHVIFVGDNFHVYELYHDGGGWHHNDLTLLTSAPPAGEIVKVEDGSWVSALAAYETTTCQNRQHVNFVGTDRHVHELVYDGAWHHNDLTQLSGAPKALSDTLVGYETTYNHLQHVIFLDNHVHELVYDGVWHHNDLTNLAGAPAAVRGQLDGYVTSDKNLEHVNFVGFVGGNIHVHELVYDGAWHHNDLTQLAGAPPFLSSSVTLNSLDGYATSYNNHKHVNFLGNDRHVHELVYDGAWHHNDLTALT